MVTTETGVLPKSVRLNAGMAFTPNEMRTLKERTGRPLNELLGGDPEDMDAAPDRIEALVWIQLRRDGYDPEWDEAGDVLPDFATEPEPDPTSDGRSSNLSSSAVSGE